MSQSISGPRPRPRPRGGCPGDIDMLRPMTNVFPRLVPSPSTHPTYPCPVPMTEPEIQSEEVGTLIAFIGYDDVVDVVPSRRVMKTNQVTDHVMTRVEAGTAYRHLELNRKAELHAERCVDFLSGVI